jgi:membrane-bound lytic murein transglycosylase MltF
MNIAITAAGSVTDRPRHESTWVERIVHRAGAALVAYRSASARPRTREELAARHELRVQADRLMDERFRDPMALRIM